MTSAGGLVAIADAQRAPAALLLSGPAGGVRAAAAVAAACGYPDAVTFDMGGTSTDVCLVRGGVPEPAPQRDGRRASRSACPRSTSTRSAPAADRSRASTRAARSSSARESAGATPGPACLRAGRDRADGDRRRPRARPHRRSARRSRGWGGSTSARPATRSTRAGVDRRRVSLPWSTPRWNKRCAWSRSSAASTRASSRSSRSAAPGRCTRARSPTRSACRAVIVPPRAGVGSAVGLLASPRRAGSRAVASAGSRSPTRAPRSRDGRARRASAPMPSSRPRSTAATSARATSSRWRTPTTSRPSTNGATVTRARARRSRSSRCEPAPRPPRRSTSPTCPPSTARVVRGPAVVAEPDCTVWIPDGWVAEPARSAPGSSPARADLREFATAGG